MPIRISQDLPAYQILQNENIFVMTHDRAEQQDIRPLKILILNIMPKKIETETQILRLLSNTPLQVDIELMHVASHVSKNTSLTHLETFYTTFAEIRDKNYDGMIITGAPVEHLPYEQVDYWDEICQIMEWSKTHVFSTLHICWAAQAGLYYHFGVPKYPLAQKMFGIFPHVVEVEHSLLLKGFDEQFYVPHSRNTEVRREDIEQVPQLEILTSSPISGVHIVANKNGRQYFITGHSEYDRDTIAGEYFRDRDKGIDIHVPYNYFPEDDPSKTPRMTWRCHANLMFSNWLNYCVYQRTPYNLDELSVRNWEWEIGI
ncbi:homoserine O-acetyltransferase MetA [Ruminococcus sp.]|uniref:homoserine O-acetyltransferase MetA n=1 Tax=Ruminococcus sp. TaxID=41978 RepID=UPI0025FA266D|nr:homoserine O-succinyltransferase [Ruminococcus sp.]MCI5816006.1 homoserine O-succinyltransferase [Ruminococcus sp.]MDY4964523.1 homoserine O-succinyltransferase [Ruminococcus callidus]